jgi:hypothetical protein
MFSYDQIRSNFNISLVREARGIIFKEGRWQTPVCWAFNKFGNYGESYAPDIDWSTAFVTEKIDGSLIKVWWDNEWHISTNGTIDAFKAELGDARMHDFGYYFLEALGKYCNSFGEFVSGLETHRTYMFELVGPYNRVVVPYDEPDLYFLGARTNASGEEYYCSEVLACAMNLGRFKRPAQYSLTSLDDCIKAAELKDWDDEGFVVADAHGNRVKIKSPAYVLAHFARNNNVITRKHLIKVILMNEVEEFLCYAADYKEELEKVQNLINSYYKVGDSIAKSCQRLYDIPKKTYAAWVQTLPNIYQDLAFRNYNNIMSTKDYTAKWNENKWEGCLEEFEKLIKNYIW